jgi:antitoxin CptB
LAVPAGMRELDVLLERYLRERYPSAPAAEQQAFERCSTLPDPAAARYSSWAARCRPIRNWAHVIARLTPRSEALMSLHAPSCAACSAHGGLRAAS